MEIFFLFALSLTAALSVNVLSKCYTKKTKAGYSPAFIFNTVTAITATIIFLISLRIGSVSSFTLILAVSFGIAIPTYSILTLFAFRNGPMSFSVVIISFSTVITALSGTLFWNERLKPLQIVGIILILTCFVFTVEKKENEKKASLKWLLLCLGAMLASGSIGLMQKIHQSSGYKDELNGFLIIAFSVASVLSAICATITGIKEKTTVFSSREKKRSSVILLIISIATGAFTAINHKLNLYLSGVIDSAIFFPIVNGGGLVLSTLASLIFFQEKLTKKQTCGVVLGIVSVICLCL